MERPPDPGVDQFRQQLGGQRDRLAPGDRQRAKDIVICDWHYDRKNDYPPIRYFQQKGFRVLPSTWKTPEGAVALIRCSRKDATERMLGILFTGWSAGGNGEGLLAALKAGDEPGEPQKPGGKSENARQTARQIAETIKAGVKELTAPSDSRQ